MDYKKIVVAGGGVLGSQIAFQTAYSGFDVSIYLINDDAVKIAKEKIEKLKETYIEAINEMANKGEWCAGISDENFDKEECLKKVERAYKEIKYVKDLKEAVKDADLLIESISEQFDIKKAFYEELSKVLEEKTVIVTNSSTLLPSKLAAYTGRPNKFLALHFANSIWKNNTAEVMTQPLTEEKYFKEIEEFANSIKMFVLPITNEKAGYLLNSMLVPFLLSAMDMVANKISTPESIDLAWKRGTGAPNGPFEIIDVVGLETALNIVLQYQKVPGLINPLLKKMMLPYNYKGMKEVLESYMKEGKTGKAAGEGFYKYNEK